MLPDVSQLVREIEANRIIREFPEAGIQVLNGRYGPYITDGETNANVPKDVAPTDITLDIALPLLAKRAEAGPSKKTKKAAKKKA